MPKFFVTYDIVTHESAARGDAAEHGFIARDARGVHRMENRPASMRLRQALYLISCAVEDSGSWFTETDGRTDYRTGDVETRSLHPPRNITPASYDRLARLLRAYR